MYSNKNDIVRILHHEGHWHIYDSNNNEGIVYSNPKHLYPKASYGEYQGKHGDAQNQNHTNNKEIKVARWNYSDIGPQASPASISWQC